MEEVWGKEICSRFGSWKEGKLDLYEMGRSLNVMQRMAGVLGRRCRRGLANLKSGCKSSELDGVNLLQTAT